MLQGLLSARTQVALNRESHIFGYSPSQHDIPAEEKLVPRTKRRHSATTLSLHVFLSDHFIGSFQRHAKGGRRSLYIFVAERLFLPSGDRNLYMPTCNIQSCT
jgi:hypothetical protein